MDQLAIEALQNMTYEVTEAATVFKEAVGEVRDSITAPKLRPCEWDDYNCWGHETPAGVGLFHRHLEASENCEVRPGFCQIELPDGNTIEIMFSKLRFTDRD